MSGKRIRLDLSDFVLDLGSHRWMFLSDAKFSTVSDLLEQLKVEYIQLEEEDTVQVFMEGDFVIPPWESIEILQSGDLVRVVRTKSKESKDKKKSTDKSKKRKQEVIRAKGNSNDQAKKKKKTDDTQAPMSSSSSDSDTSEDITSKVLVTTVKKNIDQVKVLNKPTVQNKDDSTSSDTSDSSTDEIEMNPKKQKNYKYIVNEPVSNAIVNPPMTTKAVTKKNIKSSSSDSSDSSSDSSDDETNSKALPEIETVVSSEQKQSNSKETNTTVMSDKPKRKRKRKNKNKNKLSPDQIPIFGPQIVPTEAVIRQIDNNQTSNNHVRFDNTQEQSESMDVDQGNDKANEKKAEEFTAEQIRQLYSQSVSSAPITVETDNGSTSSKYQNGAEKYHSQATIRNGQQIMDGKPVASRNKRENSKTPARTLDTSVSCEDVLMKQFDDKIVTKNDVVIQTAPKIVFTPRVLNLKEMKKDSPRNGNLKFSNRSQDPDMSQFSALLNCKDAVFNKNKEKGGEASTESSENKDYSAYHAVSDSGPRVGDVIAFKVVEMGENYAPEVSDYKEGKVLECDGTNTVTFELLRVTKKKKAGKFEIDDDAEQEEKVHTFNWADLIEPRLMFP